MRNCCSRLLLVLFFITGQIHPAAAQASELDAAQLTQILHFYQNLRSLRVTFTEKKTLKKIGTTLDSSGHLEVTRQPPKIIWQILKPSPVKIILTDGQMQMIDAPGTDHEQSQTFSAKDTNAGEVAANQAALSGWLKLDAQTLSHDYTVTKTGAHSYRFVPKVKSPFSEIIMTISEKGQLQSLNLTEQSGDSMALQFGKPEIKLGK